MLKSYLNLILEKNHLCYIVKNEVLNITSESKKSEASQIYQQVYPVGDLVMPIPNFVASPRMGLAGALHDAMSNAVGTSGGFGTMTTPLAVVSNHDARGRTALINPAVMANANALPGRAQASAGPGGAGGGTSPDFDTLIDLITQTVVPADVGPQRRQGHRRRLAHQLEPGHQPDAGSPRANRRPAGAVAAHAGSASDDRSPLHHAQRQLLRADRRRLRLHHRQEHRQPAQRRLHGPGSEPGRHRVPRVHRQPKRHGRLGPPGRPGSNPAQAGIFTQDNSIQFSQGSYALAVPQFGGFDATAGASVGFAILSDIEAYFLINAAQGDRADERPAGAQSHALQRPAGVRLRYVADAVRDQRDSRSWATSPPHSSR